MLKKQLFATKSLGVLADELAGEHRLRRVLGPVTLTSLGIGAVIGAGIFVATGEAARNTAGPALMLSYVVAGLTCVFAALCYAEFASMAPVAGSAYTYAYTTLGELLAWIIGWDLVLEYAVGASTVANGWSSYFQAVLAQFHIVLPETLRGAAVVYNRNTGAFEATGSFINLPAVLVVAVITAVLVKGIRESAGFNAVMVGIKVTAVLFVIFVGAWYENRDGKGSFGRQRVITTQAPLTYSVAAADGDGDEDVDVVSASGNDNTIAWYENTDRKGGFGSQRVISSRARIAARE